MCSNVGRPKVIMLSEVGQKEKDKYHMILLICRINCETNEIIYKKETDS